MLGTLAFLGVTVVGIVLWWLARSLRRPADFPPGPQWIPWIGNAHHMRKLAEKHGGSYLVYEHLANKYNSSVIGLKLGGDYVVYAQGYDMVREVHTREQFEGRPDNFFIRMRTMGLRLGVTCTDGELWAEHRSFTTRHLRQAGYARHPMELKMQEELQDLLTFLAQLDSMPIFPASFLAPSVINVLWAFTTGKHIARDDAHLNKLLQMLEKRSKAFDVAGGVLSQMPWLRFVIPEKSGYNLIQDFTRELHEMFLEIINEHKTNYSEELCSTDLVYAFIKESLARKGSPNNTFTDAQLTMTILDIFIAGSQTTSNTLNLALMMLLVSPRLQDKILSEVDAHLPKPKTVRYAEKTSLPYVEAYLMEIQRYFHIVPVSGPRRTLKTTKLGAYTIPKGATVLIGLRSVLMDREHWGDPDEFRPERFLTDEGKVRGDDYFIPFGQGRRRCLGDYLARACLFTFFVGIMQHFRLRPAPAEPVPSTQLLPGITLSPRTYRVCFVPR